MKMSGKIGLMWMVIGVLFGASLSAVSEKTTPAELTVTELPLEDVIKIEDQILVMSENVEIPLPPLSAKVGKVLVLRFRAVSYAPKASGWNWNAGFFLNGNPLGRYTSYGEPRLIGREATFFARDRDWELLSGFMVRLMFAPDADSGDPMLPRNQGASFAFNVSDVARGVDGNMLRISNLRRTKSADPKKSLIVTDIEIGWLDKELLPKPEIRIPARESMKESISVDGLQLTQGLAGGFSVKTADGTEVLVETTLSMDQDAESVLTADDTRSSRVKVSIKKRASGYQVTAVWPNMKLVRNLQLENGMLYWKERWTNTGSKAVALPYQHRLFLRDDPAIFGLCGDFDNGNISSVTGNPTLFLNSRKALGNGFGVTMENDWLRLLSSLRHSGGVGEIFSNTAFLPAGESIDFSLTVSPVEDGGGYWTFINDVRKRWGVNGGVAERPFFWNWAGKGAKVTTEKDWKKAFGHLGPVAVAAWPLNQLHPWVGMGFDVQVVLDESYKKLSGKAPKTVGKSPDLDVDAFLTFTHEDKYWKYLTEYVKTAHRAVPGIQIIQQIHPGLDAYYAPLTDRWPTKTAMRDADGTLFNSSYYSHAFLGDSVKKDWLMAYNVPRADSAKLKELLRISNWGMDECGFDGIYVDEFSWAYATRGYSRYDYALQDGYSADFGADGNIIRQKSDNAYTTESSQLQMVDAARQRNKFFLGNGNATLRSVNDLQALRFHEGGNGVGGWRSAHLATVPLILGNFGDQGKTSEGVFKSVLAVVENGCIYSPKECNLVLKGSDNFVSKQYPITIQEIGPGLIKAEERLITTHSGTFDWPGRETTVVLYAYDKNGDLMERGNLPRVQIGAHHPLAITVPPGGMVIAEIVE